MAKKKDEVIHTEWDQIEIGDQVKHPKWGVGTVLFRSGMGEAAKAIVVFPEEGQKKLMLKYAGLIKVGSTSLKSVEKLKAEVEGLSRSKPRPKAAPKPVKPAFKDPDDDASEDDDEEVDLDLEVEDDLSLDDDEAVVGFDDDDEEHFPGRGKGKSKEDDE